MIIDFKYKDSKGKYQSITKNIDPACLQVEKVFIGRQHYWIEKRELHLNEPKIVVWLKS